SQNLLPFVFETGVLGGRTFDVLMTRLPVEKLHRRLDEACLSYPDSKTLHDFRAPESLVHMENTALTRARKIITPHTGIAEIFVHKAEKLSWHMPSVAPATVHGSKILFP